MWNKEEDNWKVEEKLNTYNNSLFHVTGEIIQKNSTL